MTLDEVMADAARQLDEILERHLREYEAQIRRHIEATGPEDEDALDLPPDPDSPWRRSTVEEAVMIRREQLASHRAEVLAKVRRTLEKKLHD